MFKEMSVVQLQHEEEQQDDGEVICSQITRPC